GGEGNAASGKEKRRFEHGVRRGRAQRSQRRAGLRYGVRRKVRHTGLGIPSVMETCVSAPVAGSMRKTTMELLFWFSARRKLPVGSMAKWRGSLPPVGTFAVRLNRPSPG